MMKIVFVILVIICKYKFQKRHLIKNPYIYKSTKGMIGLFEERKKEIETTIEFHGVL